MRDTIYALATAPGRAAVAVVRLSGPATLDTLRQIAGKPPRPRFASLRTVRDPKTREAIDQSLVLWFPAPYSFTGEDQAELHLHGGRAVIEQALAALDTLGLRLAEPGEFSRRAFENGKLDLSQVEAVADLVDAETQSQRRQGLAQLQGALTERHHVWRARLIEVFALLEAAIDFPDEDMPADILARARDIMGRLHLNLREELRDVRGERVRGGFNVALIGAPNAGKSSLFNALLGKDAAIVASVPGTTRDVIEAVMVLEGYQIVLADMAGLRASSDALEVEGVRRARDWAAKAALRLLVVDASASDVAWRDGASLIRHGDVLVLNKCDLPAGANSEAASSWACDLGLDRVAISACSGDVEVLRAEMTRRVREALTGADFPATTRLRHRLLLSEAADHLQSACELEEAELIAERVRLASRALERIAGRIDAEAVLDEVFATFCIGK